MNESDAKAKNVRTPSPSTQRAVPGNTATLAGTEVAQLGASQAPPRIAMGGGFLTQLQPAAQTSFHLSKPAAPSALRLTEPRGIAVFPDGRRLVLSESEPGRYVVQVVSPQGQSQTYPVLLPLSPLRDKLFRVQADPQAPDEFVVIGDRGAIGYKLELLGDHLRRRYSYDLTPKEAATATLAQDGSLWFYKAPGLGKLVRGAESAVLVPLPQLQEPIWHLQPGPTAQTLWATVGTHRIVKIAIKESGSVMERTLDETPAVIHTLASAGGQVAALLLTESAGTTPSAAVVVFDSEGAQVFRQEVPGPFDPRDFWSIAIASSGHCAVGSAARLMVFELATRRLIIRQGDAVPPLD